MSNGLWCKKSEFEQTKLEYLLQISATTHLAWTEKPNLVFKQKRHHVALDQKSPENLLAIASQIAPSLWHTMQWKIAEGITRKTRIAWKRVYLAHGLRTGDGELEEAWLVVDWPEGEESPYHCYLADFLDAEPKK